MKRFFATAATALALGTAAYADGHTAAFSDMTFDEAVNVHASELIGMRVYATESELENDASINADGETEWDDIGEINDIVLTRDGSVTSVIVGVGGFIGVGEKDVAIDMSQLKFVSEDDSDDFFLVVNASATGVEDAPEFQSEKETHDAAAVGTDASTEANASAESTDNRPTLMRPEVERDGFFNADIKDLTAEDLTGTRVYGPDDEDVGEISEVLLTNDGKMDRAVIDVGGFLGMGEHPVAVAFDKLQIVRTEDGSDVRVYIDSTEETLEQQPEYKG